MPMPLKKLCCLLMFTVFVSGTVSAQKATAKSPLKCSIQNGSNTMQWLQMQNVSALKLPAKNGMAKLPLKYSVYTINNALLKKYLVGLKAKPANVVLPMPQPTGCSEFTVMNSGTMSAELAAKYPEILSMKGSDVKNPSTLLRLDYNGTELNAEITIAGVPYIIVPWKKGKNTYYLLYKKEDSGVARQPFSEGR
jgi:hypothetical protein